MMQKLRAPAKLNLYLRVLDRRPDGFYNVNTLFERISLWDELVFSPRSTGIHLTCDHPDLEVDDRNLIVRAAKAMQGATGSGRGAAIQLTKRIPIAAGLGGGSSDAATTLVGLNRLWECNLSQSKLLELGATLGSDAPFFLINQAFAIGTGRGERLESVTGKVPVLWHVLVCPKVPLSTKDVYEGLAASRASKAQECSLTASERLTTMSLHALCNGSLSELAKGLLNELEPEAIRRCPVIQEIQHHLRTGGCLAAVTSGSGPSVFGLCRDAAQAEQVACQMKRLSSEWFISVVHTCHTPLPMVQLMEIDRESRRSD